MKLKKQEAFLVDTLLCLVYREVTLHHTPSMRKHSLNGDWILGAVGESATALLTDEDLKQKVILFTIIVEVQANAAGCREGFM